MFKGSGRVTFLYFFWIDLIVTDNFCSYTNIISRHLKFLRFFEVLAPNFESLDLVGESCNEHYRMAIPPRIFAKLIFNSNKHCFPKSALPLGILRNGFR